MTMKKQNPSKTSNLIVLSLGTLSFLLLGGQQLCVQSFSTPLTPFLRPFPVPISSKHSHSRRHVVVSARSMSEGGEEEGGGRDKAMSSSSSSSRRTFLNRSVKLASATVAAATVTTVGSPYTKGAMAAPALPLTGTRAPSFSLPNSRGEGSTSLDDLTKTGKWTVLYFYPGAFTQGCTMEARNFQRDIDSYRQLNAQIVGVSVDPVEKNAQFCASEKLDFYMLSDAGGQVSRSYGSALTVPGFGTFSNRQTYIIDPKGNLRWVFTDVEGRVPRHSAEVLEKLKELVTA